MTTPVQPLDLTHIRARLTAATSGPWARGLDEFTVTAGGAPDDPWATGGSTSFGDEPPF